MFYMFPILTDKIIINNNYSSELITEIKDHNRIKNYSKKY